MKIAVADNTGMKFCQDLIDHWIEKGHEVKYERGASEYLAQWADIYYVDWIDNNLNYLWKLYNDPMCENRTPDWDNNKRPIIVCRMIDWDVWNAYVPFYEQAYIDFIDKAICIAPHIEKYIRSKADYGDKLRLIRPGVNLDKFTLKKKETDGFQIGMVLGDCWMPKQHMMGIDIFHRLWKKDKRWKLHFRGQHEGGTPYWKIMYDYHIESRGLKDAVILYDHVEDMSAWYENIDILLHPGMKEAFCYAVGEALAKGIPAVVNDFYGSHDIWSGWLYQDSEEAIEQIMMYNRGGGQLDPTSYIKEKYPLDRMLKEFDELLGL